ncbi:MAG: hypothetical protein RIB98_18485 [Acidimicrobiales bacterium]
MTSEPTLADDEARLSTIAAELEAALLDALPGWLRTMATRPGPAIDESDLAAAIDETMACLAPQLARVLGADVDAGAGNPLAVVRAGTGPITSLLVEAGAEPAARDEFDVRAFPDDLFGFGPASFADIDPSLHEPGLVWGAARAHVHLRRRRETAG